MSEKELALVAAAKSGGVEGLKAWNQLIKLWAEKKEQMILWSKK